MFKVLNNGSAVSIRVSANDGDRRVYLTKTECCREQ